jgi:hypothetical protein
MPAVFRINIDGAKQLDISFRGFEKDLGDWTETWEKIGEAFYKMEKAHFRTYDFAPLSPRYSAWKAKHFPGKPILRATDRLYKSLTEASTEDSVYIVTPRSITLGTMDPKAPAVHKRRPVISITDKGKREFRSIVQRDVVAEAKRRGFKTTGVVQGEL